MKKNKVKDEELGIFDEELLTDKDYIKKFTPSELLSVEKPFEIEETIGKPFEIEETPTMQEQTLISLSMMIMNTLSAETPRQFIRLYQYIKIVNLEKW